jgi:two-component system chemotaxis response regulator CheB
VAELPSTTRDIVAVGASAGGVEALRALVGSLPANFPAAVLVVLHMPAGGTSALASILARSGTLPAVTARNDVQLEHGVVYVSPPDHHLLVDDDRTVLSLGATENGHRPAVNALFRSVAVSAGPRAIGVQLSGNLDDGVAGLRAISRRGGKVIVQSPSEALYPAMPENALQEVEVDHVLAAAEMGALLGKLTIEEPPPDDGTGLDALLELENRIAHGVPSAPADASAGFGPPSGYMCPDCHGALMELGPHRYRCRVGHAWSGESLLRVQGAAFERALWSALRTLDEKIALARRMCDRAIERGSPLIAERYRRVFAETTYAAETLREHLATATASQTLDPGQPEGLSGAGPPA